MFHSLMMLAIDANRVVGLRVIKLMRGGRGARREAQLMVSEIDANRNQGNLSSAIRQFVLDHFKCISWDSA